MNKDEFYINFFKGIYFGKKFFNLQPAVCSPNCGRVLLGGPEFFDLHIKSMVWGIVLLLGFFKVTFGNTKS